MTTLKELGMPWTSMVDHLAHRLGADLQPWMALLHVTGGVFAGMLAVVKGLGFLLLGLLGLSVAMGVLFAAAMTLGLWSWSRQEQRQTVLVNGASRPRWLGRRG